MRRGIVLAIVVAASVASVASADELRATASPASDEPAPRKHLVYVEVFGKGGLYGLGYERTLTPRIAIGAAGSFAVVRDQQVLTLSPYVHAKLLRGRRHALFTDVGLTFVHSHIPSPVSDWDGMSDSGAGGFASLGWERDGRRVVVRAAASVVAGEGGVAPWLGFVIGVRP
jgi:hypothetical protein